MCRCAELLDNDAGPRSAKFFAAQDRTVVCTDPDGRPDSAPAAASDGVPVRVDGSRGSGGTRVQSDAPGPAAAPVSRDPCARHRGGRGLPRSHLSRRAPRHRARPVSPLGRRGFCRAVHSIGPFPGRAAAFDVPDDCCRERFAEGQAHRPHRGRSPAFLWSRRRDSRLLERHPLDRRAIQADPDLRGRFLLPPDSVERVRRRGRTGSGVGRVAQAGCCVSTDPHPRRDSSRCDAHGGRRGFTP